MACDYDVLVVGGGPAGALAARTAAQGGLRVLLVDKKSELGTPVQCSGALSAGALDDCDVPADPEFIAEPVFGFLTYSNSGEPSRLDYRAFGRREPLGYVVDRKRFDRYLTRLAAAAGAEVWLKARVVGLARAAGAITAQIERFTDRCAVSARVVVGADGIMSQVGVMAGLRVAAPLGDIASCLQYVVENVETCGLLEIVTGHAHAPGGYAWVFPKGHGMAEVGLGVARDRTDRDARWWLERLMSDSFMAPRFRHARIAEVQGGGVPLSAALKQMVADNVILIGDAARHVNPITGGGIHMAMRDGRLVGAFLTEHLAVTSDCSRQALRSCQARWQAQLGRTHAELYRLRRDIFRSPDPAQQDRALFETLGHYFHPDSKYRKV
ncbi:MAG: NAD(P)/FAD-dependent oxidoreductase [Chloroflexi bacterium]|nr:NAD(P)/FAD-dependent oxidoreductase [Chloroflexota bacterium]